MRATAIMDSRQHTHQAALLSREQGRAHSLHPDGQGRPSREVRTGTRIEGSLTTEKPSAWQSGLWLAVVVRVSEVRAYGKPRSQVQKATNSVHNELPYLKPFLAEVLRRSYRAAPARPVSHLPWPL